MNQMKKVGKGNFDIEIPVQSSDEIGTLAESFNEMSRELKKYIDQSYLAQIPAERSGTNGIEVSDLSPFSV